MREKLCFHPLFLRNGLGKEYYKQILLFPAFPDDWNVEFKLNAPYNTTVEVKRENGKLTYINVQPESRRKDVIIMGNTDYEEMK